MKDIIAKNIKTAREHAGMTQEDIAEAIPMERSAFAQYETGKNLIPLDKLARVAEVLQVGIAELLGVKVGELEPDEYQLLMIYRKLPQTGPSRPIVLKSAQFALDLAKEFPDIKGNPPQSD